MKKLFKSFIILSFVLSMTQVCFAEEYKVLVLPDNIQFDSTNYLIYPDTSIIFASDTINEIKKDNQVETVSMTEVRDTLRNNTKLAILTKKALKEFKYNYNIPFVDLKSIAHCFSTNKVLVITSQTDVQNYLLKSTIWNLLNIPGAAVIDPAYKLSTYAALIDVDKEQVLWQNTYYKTITSSDNRMLAINFAPATEQLEKIKAYSMLSISPEIAHKVESMILPPPVLTPTGSEIIDVANKKEVETETAPPPIQEEINFKPKIVTPTRPQSKKYGAVVNDL